MTKEQKAINYHIGGKVSLGLKRNITNQDDLSLAYTPGVALPCLEIAKEKEKVYNLTSKCNTVAVVTDGTAVLGLGNIGPYASIPVMEGKACLFKKFGLVDAWPVPLQASYNSGKLDIDKFIDIVAALSPMYGGINLEDIAAPACFEVEDRLEKMLDIPVFHDDQWGTGIVTVAGLINYCKLSNKNIKGLSVVINGAGAAGLRIYDMLKNEGIKDIYLADLEGVLTRDRDYSQNKMKGERARETNKRTLQEAVRDADAIIMVSSYKRPDGKRTFDPRWVLEMKEFPAVFAMANPIPEVSPEEVKKVMGQKDYIMATGRSDYPNQINNVLAFPYLFRGALDCRARDITLSMKTAAAHVLAEIIRERAPDEVNAICGGNNYQFDKDHIIPHPFDKRLIKAIPIAVTEAAIKDGVSREG
ncbi:MAG: malic enzyme-like NAD(P)-binding protein [bacterium]